MRRESTTSVAWIRLIIDSLQQHGLDCAALCLNAGLPARHLFDPEQRISQKTVSALWRAAEETSNNSCIGLSVGQQLDFQYLSAVGYSLLSSENLGQALQRLTRYQRLIGEAIQLLQAEESPSVLVFDRLDDNISHHSIEASVMGVLTITRKLTGLPIKAKMICFSHSACADIRFYEEALGCPVYFDHAQDAIHFESLVLELKIPSANKRIAQAHDSVMEKELAELLQGDWQLRLRELLFEQVPQGEPTMSVIAESLGVSSRTLQRRLADEETSFSQIVDEVRKDMAHHHIYEKQLSLQQIAYLLGYAEESNFQRAFKRWFGQSPGQYRKKFV